MTELKPGEKAKYLDENSAPHREEYNNSTVYLLRMERLHELGYIKSISVSTEVISNYQDLIDANIVTLEKQNCDLVQISCPKMATLLFRHSGSTLPTAREDFDQPAGADNVTNIAVTEVAKNHQRDTHDQIITETGKYN